MILKHMANLFVFTIVKDKSELACSGFMNESESAVVNFL